MGAICGGLVPSAPEIDVDPAEIASSAAEAVQPLVEAVPANITTFTNEVNKCGADDKFDVPNTTMQLTKDSTEDDIKKAAVASAFGDEARTGVKDAVWEQFEPTIDEQLNQAEGVPQAIKNTAKDKFREATVDPAVDKAIDEAMEKAKSS